jgi:hypothetical protein
VVLPDEWTPTPLSGPLVADTAAGLAEFAIPECEPPVAQPWLVAEAVCPAAVVDTGGFAAPP